MLILEGCGYHIPSLPWSDVTLLLTESKITTGELVKGDYGRVGQGVSVLDNKLITKAYI